MHATSFNEKYQDDTPMFKPISKHGWNGFWNRIYVAVNRIVRSSFHNLLTRRWLHMYVHFSFLFFFFWFLNQLSMDTYIHIYSYIIVWVIDTCQHKISQYSTGPSYLNHPKNSSTLLQDSLLTHTWRSPNLETILRKTYSFSL